MPDRNMFKDITFGDFNSPIKPMEEELLSLQKTPHFSTVETVLNNVNANIDSYTIPGSYLSYLSLQLLLNLNNNADKTPSNQLADDQPSTSHQALKEKTKSQKSILEYSTRNTVQSDSFR